MKLLVATHHFHPCVGGIESYVADECKYLRKKNIETEVITLNKCSESDETLPSFGALDGTKIIRLGHTRIGPIIFASGLLNHAKRADFDAIHCHAMGFFLDFLVLTKPLHKKRIFFTTQGGIFHTKKLDLLKKIYFHLWERIILRGVEITIAASENDLKTFSGITGKIVLVEDAFDSDRVNSLGAKKDRNTFLFVGRLFRNKRCDNLLRVFSAVKKQNPDFKLFIVGSDWGERKNLEQLSSELGLGKNAIFTGPASRDELAEYYDSCEFVVSASEYEGFGISVIEAMAARCIPIVNDIPTFREFTQGGNAGYVVDYSQHQNAAEKILGVINMENKDRKNLAEKVHSAVQKYSWEIAAEKLSKIFSGINGQKVVI